MWVSQILLVIHLSLSSFTNSLPRPKHKYKYTHVSFEITFSSPLFFSLSLPPYQFNCFTHVKRPDYQLIVKVKNKILKQSGTLVAPLDNRDLDSPRSPEAVFGERGESVYLHLSLSLAR